VGDAEATFSIAPAAGGPAVRTGGPFRYDAEDEQYILPISTQGLVAGDYVLTVELDDGTEHSIDLTLR
jgi:VCBS repeat-containing protein